MFGERRPSNSTAQAKLANGTAAVATRKLVWRAIAHHYNQKQKKPKNVGGGAHFEALPNIFRASHTQMVQV